LAGAGKHASCHCRICTTKMVCFWWIEDIFLHILSLIWGFYRVIFHRGRTFLTKSWKFYFFEKFSTHVFDVLRLNHGHGRHESVTRLGVFGGGELNGRGLPIWKCPVLSKRGILWKKSRKLGADTVSLNDFFSMLSLFPISHRLNVSVNEAIR
jgi:hypothetical protein